MAAFQHINCNIQQSKIGAVFSFLPIAMVTAAVVMSMPVFFLNPNR